MSDTLFLNALQKIEAGAMQLTAMIDAASTLTATGQADGARKLYGAWIKANGEHPLRYVAYFNMSGLHSQLGDTSAAADALQKSIELNADFIPAYINLGGILEKSGAADRAIELWSRGVNRPLTVSGNAVSYATIALKQMARVLSERQEVEKAEATIRQCLEINPQQNDVVEQYVALRLAQCEWPVITPSERFDRKTLLRGIHPLSMAVFTDDPLLQLGCADRYVRQSAIDVPFSNAADRRNAPIQLKSRRMRVGYISSDLRDHAVGYLMAEFFEVQRATKGIEAFVYYCGPESDSALNRRTKAAVEHWLDIRKLSDEEAAVKIAADQLDILVDVNGHTRDARLGVFARRPAPIQVNWLGYPGTMGTPYHHYIVADDWIIPRGAEKYFSEKVLRLPCYQPNDRKREVAAQTPTRREAGLPDNAFVYCCFNGSHKISRFTFERWLDILKRVPNSVLWLLEASAETKNRLSAYAEKKGVERARVIFAPKVKNANHLARYPLADVFLDTSPYGAHTTASDALWMNVPVLTISGRSFASRVCGSLVRSAGLPEMVVGTSHDYIETAVALGNHPSRVAALKAKLRAKRDRSTLFDTDKLVAKLVELYRGMIADYRKGNLPKPDLRNLDVYLEAGIEHDHEKQEMLSITDFEGHYRDLLARRHWARPIAPDDRLWTQAAIAGIERKGKKPTAPMRDASVKRRKTGTRG